MANAVLVKSKESLQQAQANMEIQEQGLRQLAARIQDDGATPALTRAYQKQYDALRQAQENYQRVLYSSVEDNYDWEARERELTEQLEEEYKAGGPHYKILIQRLVSSEMAVERIERGGRGQDSPDWRAANRAVIQAVQALQRYTESQKSEVLQTARQEGMLIIMELAERVIAPKAPELWAAFVEEVDRKSLNPGD